MRLIAFLPLFFTAAAFAEIHHAQGEMSGEVTANAALLQSRLTAIPGPVLDESGDVPGKAGVACFEWSGSPDFTGSKRSDWLEAKADHDFIVRAKIEGLKAGTRYHYRLVFGENRDAMQTGPTCSFRTLSESGDVSFCMGSCMNYHSFMSGKPNGGGPATATAEDKQLGYPAFAAMTALKPDFFIGTGDIVYYDHPPQTAAKTLPELRRKWHEQFRFPRMIAFFAYTPAFWSKDDHDFRFNDADLRGEKLPAPTTGIEIFREQMPVYAAGDRTTPTYRTHRVHQHLQLWFMEGRDFRSPNKMPDGPEKTHLGQRAARLAANHAEGERCGSGRSSSLPRRWSARIATARRTTTRTSTASNTRPTASSSGCVDNAVKNVLTFCGDRHWQYHSIHPLGVEEFSVGALNDENAIRGEKPGGPKTTDPEGKIKQPYIYDKNPPAAFCVS
jgi:alkaline phosphatase D